MKKWMMKYSVPTTLCILTGALGLLLAIQYNQVDIGSLSIAAILFITTVFAVFSIWRNKRPLHYLFFVIAFTAGLISFRINVFGSIPDEMAHYEAAYLNYNRITGTATEDIEEKEPSLFTNIYKRYQTKMRRVDAEAYLSNAHTYVSNREYNDQFNSFVWRADSSDRELIPIILRDTNSSPISYLPSIVGILIAQTLGLGFLPMIYLCRLLSLVTFDILMALSIRRTPIGKRALFMVALLPMATHLAPSFSYDSIIMGTSTLFAAQVLYLACEATEIRWRDVIITALCYFLLVQGKGVSYAGFIFLIFLIPKSESNLTVSRFKLFGITLMSGLAACILCNWKVLSNFYYPIPAETQHYSIRWLIENPGTFLLMIGKTIRVNLLRWPMGAMGRFLSWGGTQTNFYLNIALFGALVLQFALTGFSNERTKLTVGKRMIFLLPLIYTFLAYCIGMMLWETKLGSEVIGGIQGRYYMQILWTTGFVFALKSPKNDLISRSVQAASASLSLLLLFENLLIILSR